MEQSFLATEEHSYVIITVVVRSYIVNKQEKQYPICNNQLCINVSPSEVESATFDTASVSLVEYFPTRTITYSVATCN